jgi:sugar phosphate permease
MRTDCLCPSSGLCCAQAAEHNDNNSGEEICSMSSELETRVLRKITLRIVPFIMLLYFVAFIDRVNIGFAALTMNKDLGFSPTVFGFGAGIFFLGYSCSRCPPTSCSTRSVRGSGSHG